MSMVRIRIELDETSPPVWRLLEVPSSLGLDDLHEVLQVAFGWHDTHLHRFTSTSPDGRQWHYLCPFEVAEGSDGEPEDQVRVVDVLPAVGDRLDYLYDYGDGWRHRIGVVAIDADDADRRVTCLDGARPGPPEDCGGPFGYELITAARDADHPSHDEAVEDFAAMYGGEVDATSFELAAFDVDEVNAHLADLAPWPPMAVADIDGPLGEFLRGVRQSQVRRRLLAMVATADLDTATSPDEQTAATMVRPYRWLVDHVGPDGIVLTGAGYLPPVHVQAAMEELALGEEWIGAGNREHLTMPVLNMRQSARDLGLVRVHRGRLLATRAGRDLVEDPVGLWLHLARRMPMGTRDKAEHAAGMVVLLAVAARSTDDLDALVASVLNARGWGDGDGRPLRPVLGRRIAYEHLAVLRRMGALTGSGMRDRDRPTDVGRAFARMALTTARK